MDLKKNRKRTVLVILTLLLCTMGTADSYAAKVTVKTYRSLYQPIVKNGFYYLGKTGNKAEKGSVLRHVSFFALYDVDRNGIKELLCEPSDETSYGLRMIDVFTISGKKAAYCGQISWNDGYPHKLGCFYYNKNYKALYTFDKSKIYGGGVLGQEKCLYHLSGKKLVSCRFWKKWGISSEYSYYTGTNSAKAKQVNAKKAGKYVRSYFKGAKKVSMLKNNAANIRKTFG